MTQDDFDYGQLTKEWWHETGATIGASEKAIKFSAAKFCGKSNTEAAWLAMVAQTRAAHGRKATAFTAVTRSRSSYPLPQQKPAAVLMDASNRKRPSKSYRTWLGGQTRRFASRP
jgi:hypothetical protein